MHNEMTSESPRIFQRRSCAPVLMTRSHSSLLLANPKTSPTASTFTIQQASPLAAVPASPALSPSTPTVSYLNLTMTRHTIITFATASTHSQLSSSEVYSELVGSPLFRYVHDPDLVELLRCLSSAGQYLLTPYTCLIRWRSPWEQRYRRTEVKIMLLGDGCTFDISLKRPQAAVVEARKITRVAHINMNDINSQNIPFSSLRQAYTMDDFESSSTYSDEEEPAEAEVVEAGSKLDSLRHIIEQTLPSSIEGYCSAAIDSVEGLSKEPPLEMIKGSVGVVMNLSMGLGMEAGKLVWSKLSKQPATPA